MFLIVYAPQGVPGSHSRTQSWRLAGLTCLPILLLSISPAAVACALCPVTYAGGDPIGPDNSLTDHTGGFTAVRKDGVNLGQPAIQVSLTGQDVLSELRVIVFGLPTADGTMRFDQFDYRLNLWKSADYFGGGDPQLHYDLGDPIGIQLVEEGPTRVVPDSSFGSAGAGGGDALTYDFHFDLTQLPLNGFSDNLSPQVLPAGDWVLGFQSWHNSTTSGSLRVAGAAAPEGPLPLFSRDAVDRGILGGQDPDEIALYWGMSLAVTPAIPATDGGDLNLDGVVDAADYTAWRDGLGGSYGITDYQCWRANFGASPSLNGSPGDFNADGVVDAADYTMWRDNLGNASESVIDFAGDGLNGVDDGDYELWRVNFENQAGTISDSLTVVPEPSTMFLLLVSICWLDQRSKRRTRVLTPSRQCGGIIR